MREKDKKEPPIPSDKHFAALYDSLTAAGLRPPIWRLAKYKAASKANARRIHKYLRERIFERAPQSTANVK